MNSPTKRIFSMDSTVSNGQVATESVAADADSRPVFQKIDHIAIAVRELESAIVFYTQVLGFQLMRRLEIKGRRTGMISAELERNGLKFVLVQGTEPESQVSQLIDHYGPGVAHIAFGVDDVEGTVADLASRGLEFDTTIIKGPGLTQAFSSRCPNSGMSFEFIKRESEQGFHAQNVQELFDQLEKANAY
jgi:4-hydroxyphenylpyruvate dioxygenase-like putative hemolysin